MDVDRRTTWPAAVTELVEAWHHQVGVKAFAADLSMPDSADTELLSALDGHRVRGLHCTRLLPHEADQIRGEGLRTFATDLFDGRLVRARQLGHLTDEQHQRLRDGHLGAAEAARARGRWNRVYLSLGEAVLDDLGGVERLLGRWGGEGIYFSAAGLADEQLLESIGRPTVVVCAFDVTTVTGAPLTFPSLSAVFLGAARGIRPAADVVLDRPLATHEIEFLAGPGDEFYDAHPALPDT